MWRYGSQTSNLKLQVPEYALYSLGRMVRMRRDVQKWVRRMVGKTNKSFLKNNSSEGGDFPVRWWILGR